MKAIVTTTINPPTLALQAFAKMQDWQLYVVGDLKTPDEAYADLNCVYISPAEQQRRFPALSDSIGWNCIQRRNIGYVAAYLDGAEIIASVDDDVIPYKGWGCNLLIGSTVSLSSRHSDNGVFDPLAEVYPWCWHRGYPPELLRTRNSLPEAPRQVTPNVQVDLWDGKPDIDAMCRLIEDDPILNLSCNSFTTGDTAIFNSQNTFFRRDMMPHYAVMAHADRMDDIWGAIVLQRSANAQIVYRPPSVYHCRNDHDLYGDVVRESKNLKDTLRVCKGYLPDECQAFMDLYQACFK